MTRMGLAPIYQRPKTSEPHPRHKIYPYLLRHLAIERPNQVSTHLDGWLKTPIDEKQGEVGGVIEPKIYFHQAAKLSRDPGPLRFVRALSDRRWFTRGDHV